VLSRGVGNHVDLRGLPGGRRSLAEPVSGRKFLGNREKTGKILENRAEKAKSAPKYRSLVSGLRIKFPTPPNREFIRGEQGIVFAEQRSEWRL
jgi:hypothetical protein